MRAIFSKLRYKNYLATGNNFIEIDFLRSPSTLIVGRNGAGKTTIISALTWVLFNNPYRNITLPQLVNSINGKDCVGEVEFSIANTKYLVRRGIAPDFFEIWQNGKLIPPPAKKKDYQDFLEKNILKMNYKSFTQIVVLGSTSFVPFMALKAADRRAVIEEILDIQIFSSMNVIVKQKLALIKESIDENKRAQEVTEEKIKFVRTHISNVKVDVKKKIADNNSNIEKFKIDLNQLQEEIALLEKEQHRLENLLPNQNEIEKKIALFDKAIIKSQMTIDILEVELEFYKENDDCPSCHQHISDETKIDNIEDSEKKLKENQNNLEKLKKLLEKEEICLNSCEKLGERISLVKETIYTNDLKKTGFLSYIKKLQDENKELALAPEAKTGGEVYGNQLKQLLEEMTKLKKEKETLIVDKEYMDAHVFSLKNSGTKTKIIKKYLPKINELVNKYLDMMGFFVQFNLDENFKEIIKSRHRDEFSYESFSDGEKMRIDLSLLWTWRGIAKQKNSISTNLLILDEVMDKSLETEALDALLKILGSFDEGTNVFVISHKEDILTDKFRSLIKFKKINNFSQITVS